MLQAGAGVVRFLVPARPGFSVTWLSLMCVCVGRGVGGQVDRYLISPFYEVISPIVGVPPQDLI